MLTGFMNLGYGLCLTLGSKCLCHTLVVIIISKKILLFDTQAFDLNEAKSRIQAYVESRMSFIAPNLSAIIGSSTAAKIMGKISLMYSGQK